MTRYILLVATAALTYVQACGQDMNEALKKTFLAFDTTQDLTVKTAQGNKLALIAKKWNDEWAAHYYNAYAKTQLSFMMPANTVETILFLSIRLSVFLQKRCCRWRKSCRM